MEASKPALIAVTGTKGKTTIVRLLNHALLSLNRNVLLVDSDGHYLNGVQKSASADSLRLHDSAPTVCPGKFLYELKDLDHAVAVLESSIGSNGRSGMGYRWHDIGIFSNVYEDHLDRTTPTREMIALKKGNIVFKPIKAGGIAVFNADDPLVVSEVRKIRKRKQIKLIPVTLESKLSDSFETDTSLCFEFPHIILRRGESATNILDVQDVPITFGGKYMPSILNLLLVLGSLFHENLLTSHLEVIQNSLKSFVPKEEGGRMVFLKNEKENFNVFIDFAHEKYSLIELAKFARCNSGGRVIGIVRFAPDRTDEQIQDYAEAILPHYDVLITYDRVDGINRLPRKSVTGRPTREVGEVSEIVYSTWRKIDPSKETYRKVPEDEALMLARELVKEGDIIVHISNDHVRSLELVKDILLK